ncbi:MAG TPA: HAD-IC family P-type ATPase, partial [Actinomycetota bacterium]
LDTVVLDKTGTITRGEPALTDVVPLEGTEEDLLRLTAAAERASEHPLAAAVIRGAEERGIQVPPAEAFDSVTGKGVKATVDGRELLVGTRRLLSESGVDIAEAEDLATGLEHEGKTVMLVASGGRVLGAVAVADTIKPGSAKAIAALRNLGLDVVMITGDNARTAAAIAREAGIGRVLAEVLPEGKEAEILRLRDEGRRVAMVGDGINDAPALARADVGMAIGTGTDVAIEAADVTIISGDLRGVVTAVSLSRATMRNIRQNLVLAFVYNVVGIPVAAGLLYPFTGLLLSPMIAAGAMALSSLSVVGNANRLRRYAPKELPEGGPAPVEPSVETGSHAEAPATAIDPVCGMEVDPATAADAVEHQGTTYHFCSKGCAERFRKDPQAYLGAPTGGGHHGH